MKSVDNGILRASRFQNVMESWSVVLLLLVSVTVMVYRQVSGYGYLDFDDRIYLAGNSWVQKGFTPEALKWAWTTQYAHYWGPLTWLSFIGEVHWFGLHASVSHTINLVLHTANAVLLYTLLRMSTRAALSSLLVALLFAVHPLHVESVAWVAERKDVLSAFFGLLTLCAYVRYCSNTSWQNYSLVLPGFALAVCTKPVMVTLPLLMWILDDWPLQRSLTVSSWHRIREKLPLAAISLVVAAITIQSQQEDVLNPAAQFASLAARLAFVANDYLFYLYHLFVPFGLAVFYPRNNFPAAAWWIAAALLLPLLTVATFRYRKQMPWLWVGWLWYVFTLLPMSGIVTFGRNVAADRFTYIPAIGIFIMVVWTIDYRWPARNHPLPVSGLWVAIMAGLMAIAYQQTTYWQNDLTLFQHASDVTRDNYLADNNLGTLYLNNHEAAKALPLFEQANRLFPDDRETLNNLGISLDSTGNPERAETVFRRAVALFPEFSKPYVNLGALLTRQQHYNEAIPLFEKALQLEPDNIKAMNNLAAVYLLVDRTAEAMPVLQRAIALTPDNGLLYYNLGYADYKTGNKADAIVTLEKAQSLMPDSEQIAQLLKMAKDIQP